MPERMFWMPQDMPERISEYMPDRVPERMSEDMPDRMPERMSERMSEDMPDRMSEDMPDRMSEDMLDMRDRWVVEKKWCCSLVSFGQVAYLDISFQSCGVCSYICHGGDHSKWSNFCYLYNIYVEPQLLALSPAFPPWLKDCVSMGLNPLNGFGWQIARRCEPQSSVVYDLERPRNNWDIWSNKVTKCA